MQDLPAAQYGMGGRAHRGCRAQQAAVVDPAVEDHETLARDGFRVDDTADESAERPGEEASRLEEHLERRPADFTRETAQAGRETRQAQAGLRRMIGDTEAAAEVDEARTGSCRFRHRLDLAEDKLRVVDDVVWISEL